MSVHMDKMETTLDMLCPALKKAEPATNMNTISVRRWYRRNSEKVKVHKLLGDIAKRGRCVNASTINRLSVTREQIVAAWLQYRKEHEPVGNKQLKMQQLVAGWM